MSGAEEMDDRLFDGLTLEEPSPRTDAAVLGLARRRPAPRRERRILWAHAGLAAGIVLGLFLVLPGDRIDPRAAATGSRSTATAAPAVGIEDIAELRSELDQIGEMVELIPDDRTDEREEIDARLRVCLRELESLELKLGSFDQGSIGTLEAKEARI